MTILRRLHQFRSAISAQILCNELNTVQAMLSPNELNLFISMDIVDQRHCFEVFSTCKHLLASEKRKIDSTLLLKAALLHDVGKQAGDMTITNRITAVLMRHFWKHRFLKLAQDPSTPYYVSLHHPEIGATKCERAGCSPALVNLVRHHQTGGEGVELELLYYADSRH